MHLKNFRKNVCENHPFIIKALCLNAPLWASRLYQNTFPTHRCRIAHSNAKWQKTSYAPLAIFFHRRYRKMAKYILQRGRERKKKACMMVMLCVCARGGITQAERLARERASDCSTFFCAAHIHRPHIKKGPKSPGWRLRNSVSKAQRKNTHIISPDAMEKNIGVNEKTAKYKFRLKALETWMCVWLVCSNAFHPKRGLKTEFKFRSVLRESCFLAI